MEQNPSTQAVITIPFADFPPEIKLNITRYLGRAENFVLGHLDGFQAKRTQEARIPGVCRAYAEAGHLNVVKWIWEKYRAFCSSTKTNKAHIVVTGVATEQRWASKARWDLEGATWRGAAKGGHIDILEWLCVESTPNCMWGVLAMTQAARLGQVRVLDWSRTKGFGYPRGFYPVHEAMTSGHLQVANWALRNGYKVDERCPDMAAAAGHLHMLIWTKEHGCRISSDLPQTAALDGHLHILQWCIENGSELTADVMANAAKGGHLDILKWATANGCSGDDRVFREAAWKGDINVLEWALANGYIWRPSACVLATSSGHFNALKWLREKGCPWDATVCYYAARCGRMDILQWAVENGCQWDRTVAKGAVMSGRGDILAWIRQNGGDFDEAACSEMGRTGNISMLKWARQYGFRWDSGTCYGAASGGHSEVLDWAVENGCEFNLVRLLQIAGEYDESDESETNHIYGYDCGRPSLTAHILEPGWGNKDHKAHLTSQTPKKRKRSDQE